MKQTITNSNDVAKLLYEPLSNLLDEQLTVISLNSANRVIAIHNEVTKGTCNSVQISVKQIARIAVLDYASGVIIAHNHPSGNARPSQSDIQETQRVKAGLNLLDIQLIDHIIIGDNYYSFAEESERPVE